MNGISSSTASLRIVYPSRLEPDFMAGVLMIRLIFPSLMRDGKINLIINTPAMKSGSRRDGYTMRRLAVELEIPFMTTVQGANIAVGAIRVGRGEKLKVRSMKEFHVL